MDEIVDSFRDSLTNNSPNDDWPVTLRALWLDGKGDWEGAHDLVQHDLSENAAWVHAYLHRKEGDVWNADYWYGKANRKRPSVPLDEEWASIVRSMLKSSSTL